MSLVFRTVKPKLYPTSTQELRSIQSLLYKLRSGMLLTEKDKKLQNKLLTHILGPKKEIRSNNTTQPIYNI